MVLMEDEIFKKSILLEDKLLDYGFIKEKESLIYKKDILNNTFQIILIVTNNRVQGKIIDKESNDEYTNFRVENQTGEFAGNIKNIYKAILIDIRNKCTKCKYFIKEQSNRIAQFIKEKYDDYPEFLFNEDTTGVFRNLCNRKWYGIIMHINTNKIGASNNENDVLDVKLDSNLIENLISKKGYYKAYHMNKKNWITIILDDTLSDKEIFSLIEQSHKFTEK